MINFSQPTFAKIPWNQPVTDTIWYESGSNPWYEKGVRS